MGYRPWGGIDNSGKKPTLDIAAAKVQRAPGSGGADVRGDGRRFCVSVSEGVNSF